MFRLHLNSPNNLLKYLKKTKYIFPLTLTVLIPNAIFFQDELVEYEKFEIHNVVWFLYEAIKDTKSKNYLTAVKIFKDASEIQIYFGETFAKFIQQENSQFTEDYIKFLNYLVGYCIENFNTIRDYFRQVDAFIHVSVILLKLYTHMLMNFKEYCIKPDDHKYEKIKTRFESFLNSIYSFLGNGSFETETYLKLKCWSSLYSIGDCFDQETNENISQILNEHCAKKLDKYGLDDLIDTCEKISTETKEKYHHNLDGVVFDKIIEKLDKDLKKPDMKKLTQLSASKQEKMTKLANRIFAVKWPKNETQNELLEFSFEFTHFIKTFWMIESKCDLNNNNLQNKLVQIKSLILQIIQNFRFGEIENVHLKHVAKNSFHFIELCDIFMIDVKDLLQKEGLTEVELIKIYVENIIKLRLRELENFENFMKTLELFMPILKKHCAKYVKVNLNGVETEYHEKKKYMENKLDFCCCPLKATTGVGRIVKDDELNEQICGFDDVQKNQIDFIKKLLNISNNKLYDHFVEESIKEYCQRTAITDFMMCNYLRCCSMSHESWTNFGKSLVNGTIVFDEVLNYTNDIIKINWYQEFDTLLKYIDCAHSKSKAVLNKIEILRKLENISKILDLFQTIIEKMKLNGDFETLKKLQDLISRENVSSKYLKDLNEKFMDAFQRLDQFASEKEKIECLESYNKNFIFITWLREHAPNRGALKLLADFASESENEGALEVTRVQTLLLVGTSYAPLIYDLQEITDYEALLRKIDQVFVNLKNNPQIAERLTTIAKERAWLEDIKDAKRNTGANSLKQADRINRTGVYTVQYDEFKCENFQKLIDLSNIIELTVPKNVAAKHQEKKYNFNEIKDLHDKLTLVVGKSEAEQEIIKQFENTFEGVIGLSSIFSSLLKSGNISFKDWNTKIYCGHDSPITIKINFSSFDTDKHIVASRTEEPNTCEALQKVRQCLEQCCQFWSYHVQTMREQHNLLNYFTTSQLVVLRTELAKYNSDSLIKDGQNIRPIKDLLYNINETVDDELLRKANAYALKKQRVQEMDVDQNTDNKNEIIDQLKFFGFSQMLIQHALKNVQSDDSQDYINYCMRENFTVPEAVAKNEAKPLSLIKTEDLFEATMSNGLNRFEENLSDLCKKFESIMNANYLNFLSLTHLALALDYLKKQSNKIIKRLKPPYLEHSVPNLIVCEQSDILARVLNLYLYTASECMPNDDEILVCTESTTSNEVEIFLSRAVKIDSNADKIYSIVNVHDLTYDNAVRVLQAFEDLNKQNNFMLCLFCSQEQEDKCIFVTAYNRYRINLPKKLDYKCIQNYLMQHLRLPLIKENEINSAALSEKNHLTARVIRSERAGVGKSLYVNRVFDAVQANIDEDARYCCVSVKAQKLNNDEIFEKLKKFDATHYDIPRVFHIDIAYEVWKHVDRLLFELFVTGLVKNSNGELWRRSQNDLYLIEIMSPILKSKDGNNETGIPLHSTLNYLPTINCLTPLQIFDRLRGAATTDMSQNSEYYDHFDDEICKSSQIQRPCQYLQAINNNVNLETMSYDRHKILSEATCLEILLQHCEIPNPSWSEIIHFASFLNTQLEDSEGSCFCQADLAGDLLPGFKTFVVKFMIQMSHDFALPSLVISDRSALQIDNNYVAQFNIEQVQMRRRWERSPHPYLFFNPDGQTFTFFGFNVKRQSGELVDPQSGERVFTDLKLSKDLIMGINLQDRSLLVEDISKLSKSEKISKILHVMGKKWASNGMYVINDPDPSYELTMDNVLKMMAIYMRFRCNIPVVICGEAGCGKTALIKYLCDLQKNPGDPTQKQICNLYLVKVHGGVTSADIAYHVDAAQKLAQKNFRHDQEMCTILFFDEANSTEAIGTIKEIMCDGRINGEKIDLQHGLKIIAACNPYRKHTEEMIKKFEQSGLGYFVDANDLQEKLGNLPMRQLVYRVQPLPSAMLPIIWDFGHLTDEVEKMYITQIVEKRCIVHNHLFNRLTREQIDLTIELLAVSHHFMRQQENECSFVSLRDIQRVLAIIEWFMRHSNLIGKALNARYNTDLTMEDDDYETEDVDEYAKTIILALCTSYHVRLQNFELRRDYRRVISNVFDNAEINEKFIFDLMNNCYEIFLEHIDLPDAIARNQALKENVFMMIICIELKIPLFVIGKPGSSKSLAKTLIAQKMQGAAKYEDENIFSHLKEAHLITFQCSPLSTSEMILNTFRHCAKFQLERANDLDRYVSVVVLDEIGLAEASSSMPLKALHPLLEEGVYFDTQDEDEFRIKHANMQTNDTWRKVGFIGISNWVLDPAKMNRGIFVNRCSPNENELKDIAIGICRNDENVINIMEQYLPSLANGYIALCEHAKKHREFFGLRDFYSLIKMIYYEVKEKNGLLNNGFLEKAIRRNFGGLVHVNPLDIFIRQFDKDELRFILSSQNANIIELVKEALSRKVDKKAVEGDTRYLLLLAQNENALDLLNNYILEQIDAKNTKIIFGSSFPNDQNYTQICRQIHQIKLSMELGKTVILLNLENLYESLYDALNQFYYKFGDNEKFVDLGLGTQRIKCLVHDDFRLIVIADKNCVYDSKRFPIPLVNRLEKHCLTIESILNSELNTIVGDIKQWCEIIVQLSSMASTPATSLNFAHKRFSSSLKLPDVFIGYTDDTIASLVLKFSSKYQTVLSDYDQYEWVEIANELCQQIKTYLLQCATSDAIIRLDQQLHHSSSVKQKLSNQEINKITQIYFTEQNHNSFQDFCSKHLFNNATTATPLIQITTHSKLLSINDLNFLKTRNNVQLVSLLAFNTQQQFIEVLTKFMQLKPTPAHESAILIIQCDCSNYYTELISCARYSIVNEYMKYSMEHTNKTIILVLQVPKISGGCIFGFQTAKWFCYHIDDLQDNLNIQQIYEYRQKSLGELFNDCLNLNTDMQLSAIGRFVLNILKSSIYSVCSKITDTSNKVSGSGSGDVEIRNRCLERVDILIKLFHNETSEFCLMLFNRLTQLQIEREHCTSTTKLSKTWIYNEVAKYSNVMKYGTLRSSCRNYIESRLSFLLAGLIAYIDKNLNLNTFFNSTEPWLKRLWLNMFNNNHFVHIEYLTHYLQANNFEKNEFLCISNVPSTASIQYKLPFSWIIKEFIDELVNKQQAYLKTSDKSLSSVRDMYNRVSHVFTSSKLYEQLVQIVDKNNNKEIFEYYLNDFLLQSYATSLVNEEHLHIYINRLIEHIFTYYTKSMDCLTSLVAIHLSHLDLNEEFKLFTQFLKYSPKPVQPILLKIRQTNLNVCFMASNILCKAISTIPVGTEQDAWSKWLNTIANSSWLIETFINKFQTNDDGMNEFKSHWERTIVLRLFLEHVCESKNVSTNMYVYCSMLWKYLKDPVNLRSATTIKHLVDFLNCIHDGMKNKCEQMCKHCLGCNALTSGLCTTNQCKCILCEACTKTFKQNSKCPGCERDAGAGIIKFELLNDPLYKNFEQFKSNIDTFFFDVISTLCLNDENHLPDSSVIMKLIEHVKPKPLNEKSTSTYDLGITIKSTLLQLLLKYNQEDVDMYLNELFQKSVQFLEKYYSSNDLIDLNLMYINAIEDSLYANGFEISNKNSNLTIDMKLSTELIEDLKQQIYTITTTGGHFEHIMSLRFIAQIKFILVTCSKLVSIYDDTMSDIDDHVKNEFLHYLDDFVSLFPLYTDWMRYFLIKYIFRRYGKQKLINTRNYENTKWIVPDCLFDETKKHVLDSYISCGANYMQIRAGVRENFFKNDLEKIEALVNVKENSSRPIYYVLSAFQSITLSNFFKDKEQQCKEFYKIMSKKFSKLEDCFKMVLLGKNLPIHFMNDNANIALLVVHMYATAVSLAKTSVFKPFMELIKDPMAYATSYFPTMPDDEDFDAYQVFRLDKVKFYKCPNGHMYSIGDCTKPATVAKCATCKEPIGGQGHALIAGNTEATDLRDQTYFGYGPYTQQQIRSLSPINRIILRIMLSCTLYVSSLFHKDTLNRLIWSNQNASQNMSEYFAVNLYQDLKHLALCMQHSMDECLLFVHFILNESLQLANPQYADQVKANDCHWKTKQSRLEYENLFCDRVLSVLNRQSYETVIHSLTRQLENDVEYSNSDILFQVAYDFTKPNTESNLVIKYLNEEKCWSYRVNISLEHMINTFHSKYNKSSKVTDDKSLKLLAEFISKTQQLEFIKYLPDIIQMLNVLHTKYNRQIDRQQAKKLLLADLLDENYTYLNESAKETIRVGAVSFLHVWSFARSFISTMYNGKLLDKMDSNVDVLNNGDVKRLPLSYILSGTVKDGRYLYAIVFYLTELQNEFLRFYFNQINTAKSNDMDMACDIQLNCMSIKSSDCICFSCNKDLLKIIYLCSNYSLNSSNKTINIEYNFRKIQNEIETKILLKKCLLDNQFIPIFEFCDDLNDIYHLDKLNNIVQQAEISYAVKDKITKYYKIPNQLSEIVRILGIVIDFVVSSGCANEMKIIDYAVNVLKMETCEEADICKAIYDLEIKYLRSLWICLCFHRSILLTKHGQDPFDRLSENYKLKYEPPSDVQVDLNTSTSESSLSSPDSLILEISNGKKFINTNNVNILLNIMYEFITFKLATSLHHVRNENVDTDNNEYANIPLNDALYAYLSDNMSSSSSTGEVGGTDLFNLNEFNLKKFHVKNIFFIWNLLVASFVKIS